MLKENGGRMSRLILTIAMVFCLMGSPGAAQEMTALARLLPGQASLVQTSDKIALRLGMTQAVPYRVFTLADPYRVVLDFNELDWTGLNADTFNAAQNVETVRMGAYRPGWSRMVLVLNSPMELKTGALLSRDDLSAEVLVELVPTDDASFRDGAGAPDGALFAPETGVKLAEPKRRQTGEHPLVVVLDPGHGGIDPGAEAGGVVEAQLMLIVARELQEALIRVGNFDVFLTRNADVFVPLERRVSIAREVGADVFISLHADALLEGRASGATVYTLSEEASDLASQKLSERHERSDLLAGVDLTEQDDVIANVLMDMARIETAQRSDKLADQLVDGLTETVGMHKRPKLAAGFSVLKAADIPSVLVELGFLSSKRDRENLVDPEWRALAVDGIVLALERWAVQDAADALLLRQ